MEEKCILDPNRDCPGIVKARELEEEFSDFKKRNESSHKEYYSRIAVLEQQNAVQNEQYRNIMEKLVSMTESLKEIREDGKEIAGKLSPLVHRVNELEKKYDAMAIDVKTMKEKPGKKWENAVEKILVLILSAIVGIVLAKIGLQ